MPHMITSLQDLQNAKALVAELMDSKRPQQGENLFRLIRKYTKTDGGTFSKSELLFVCPPQSGLEELLKKKPIRTLSGVTPVTVLTKPYPCPGQCIFCPSDVRMPKSYIANEPGAQRAGQYGFQPYAEMYSRLQAFREIGHPTSKIELIILGGTWSAYPESYRLWFIRELFKALNDFGEGINNQPTTQKIELNESLPKNQTYNQYISTKLPDADDEVAVWEEVLAEQRRNETTACRCVGLVLETRPDYITEQEVVHLRKLGATKIQLGFQSMQNEVLKLNKRGHTVEKTIEAVNMLRQAGFKIHGHWMPNLFGSNPTEDQKDYVSLFNEKSVCPDELKVYPCSLIDHTELMNIYQQGLWQPYTLNELTSVLQFVITHTPEYCRLTRIVRDIPGTEIVAGNKSTNLRQLVETKEIASVSKDIRAREIKSQIVDVASMTVDDVIYKTPVSTEHFLQYITPERKIAGFLRLSIPLKAAYITELSDAALIREIHVYGQSVSVGTDGKKAAQHQGLGKLLIKLAANIATKHQFKKLSVISAIGTRQYYRDNGFTDGALYQHLILKPSL